MSEWKIEMRDGRTITVSNVDRMHSTAGMVHFDSYVEHEGGGMSPRGVLSVNPYDVIAMYRTSKLSHRKQVHIEPDPTDD